MSGLEMLLHHPAVSRLSLALLHFLWQGAALAAMAVAALAAMRRSAPTARYLVLLAVLGAMAATPVATFLVLPNFAATAGVPAPAAVEGLAPAGPLAPGADVATQPARALAGSGGAHLPAAGQPPPSASRTAPGHTGQWLDAGLAWVAAGWFVGVCILSLRLLLGWIGVARARRRGVEPAGDQWKNMMAALAHRLRVSRPVRLLESAVAQVPTVMGWLRPVILLPASALSGLTPEQVEALIAHELAHIRRGDYLVNLLQTVIETLLFYHPTVWWVSHRIRVEREHCCDDLAVACCGDALTYARALTEMEHLRGATTQLAVSARGGSLLTRIRRLADGSRDPDKRAHSWLAALLALAAVTLVTVSIQLTARASLAQVARFSDDFDRGAASLSQWKFLPGTCKVATEAGHGVLQLRGIQGDEGMTRSENYLLADGGKAYETEGLTLSVRLRVSKGYGCSIFWGYQGPDETSDQQRPLDRYYLSFNFHDRTITLAEHFGERTGLVLWGGTLAVHADPAIKFGKWYDVKLVSEDGRFRVWLAEADQPMKTIIDAPIDLLHKGVVLAPAGYVGMANGGAGAEQAEFDRFRLQGRRAARPVANELPKSLEAADASQRVAQASGTVVAPIVALHSAHIKQSLNRAKATAEAWVETSRQRVLVWRQGQRAPVVEVERGLGAFRYDPAARKVWCSQVKRSALPFTPPFHRMLDPTALLESLPTGLTEVRTTTSADGKPMLEFSGWAPRGEMSPWLYNHAERPWIHWAEIHPRFWTLSKEEREKRYNWRVTLEIDENTGLVTRHGFFTRPSGASEWMLEEAAELVEVNKPIPEETYTLNIPAGTQVDYRAAPEDIGSDNEENVWPLDIPSWVRLAEKPKPRDPAATEIMTSMGNAYARLTSFEADIELAHEPSRVHLIFERPDYLYLRREEPESIGVTVAADGKIQQYWPKPHNIYWKEQDWRQVASWPGWRFTLIGQSYTSTSWALRFLLYPVEELVPLNGLALKGSETVDGVECDVVEWPLRSMIPFQYKGFARGSVTFCIGRQDRLLRKVVHQEFYLPGHPRWQSTVVHPEPGVRRLKSEFTERYTNIRTNQSYPASTFRLKLAKGALPDWVVRARQSRQGIKTSEQRKVEAAMKKDPKVGSKISLPPVEDLRGNSVRLPLEGKVTALIYYPDWDRYYDTEDVEYFESETSAYPGLKMCIVFAASDPKDVQEDVRAKGYRSTFLYDRDGKLGKALNSAWEPRLYIIGGDGTLLYVENPADDISEIARKAKAVLEKALHEN